jgi:hypothetical protein
MTAEGQSQNRDERREFFRIDDSIKISFRLLGPESMQPPDQSLQSGGEDSLTIITRLQAISRQMSASLRRIEQRDADVADYLRALDEKITLLAQSFLADESSLTEQPSRSVNLGAGGLAMDSAEPLAMGSRIQIRLLLLPSYIGVVAFGEVVGVEQTTEDPDLPYRLHINFTHIPEHGRDALIRHILRRQADRLRRQRGRVEGDRAE